MKIHASTSAGVQIRTSNCDFGRERAWAWPLIGESEIEYVRDITFREDMRHRVPVD